MEREDVVRVLHRCRVALVPGAVMLDLQVIPPEPVVEVYGAAICSLEDGGLLDDAATATGVVDELVERGLLYEDGVDDHEVLHHCSSGPALIEYFQPKRRSIPVHAIPLLAATDRPCVVREACRMRRLRVPR